jgi:transcriptional regulator with XRE-family HTH domain
MYNEKMLYRNGHGEKIRAARKRLGETQEQFAKRFGVDRATISRWEASGIPHKGPGRALMVRVLAELRLSA